MIFPQLSQLDSTDCGSTCLRMILKWYGKDYNGRYIREITNTDRIGVSLSGLSRGASMLGLKTFAVKITTSKLISEAQLPAILHWNQDHFVVLYEIKSKLLNNNHKTFCIADPAHGKIKLTEIEFKKHWCSGQDEGVALLLEPTKDFYSKEIQSGEKKKPSPLGFMFPYIKPYYRLVIQLFIGLLVGSLLQFIFPFLTQSVVDIGIRHQNIHFIYIVLIASLMLFLGQTIIELVRGRILLHISARINISLISDFLIKLMRLPIAFFDSKLTGDIIQRIGDHNRVQSVMTGSAVSVLFSIINIVVFSIILLFYSRVIFIIFFISTLILGVWIVFFLRYRKEIDYKRFHQSSLKQSNLIQIIQGMQEIKLQNAELRHKWNWEKIQAQGFKIDIQAMDINNLQSIGALLINQFKNILITVVSAKLVIDGHLTLGMMLSVQYIIGQINAPISQLLGFVQQLQDASLSLERLNEIHQKPNEENPNEEKTGDIPKNADIHFSNISFSYVGSEVDVLKNLNFTIPFGKTTAIVGSSGSGKTTLLKLIMKFYEPKKGSIKIGNTDLKNLKSYDWRDYFGAVLQDGFIFSDTIARNIAVKDDSIDKVKLLQAVRMANIEEYIEELPLGFNTKIGQDGIGLSMGQRQRLLIARAVYKEPKLLLFDEATNSLDTTNERKIVENINSFLQNKTAVIVAHRLSTVKDADNIIVLEKGEIVEQGTHEYLTSLRGVYYTLVKNQLELGQ